MVDITPRLASTVEQAPQPDKREGKDTADLDVDELIDFAMNQ